MENKKINNLLNHLLNNIFFLKRNSKAHSSFWSCFPFQILACNASKKGQRFGCGFSIAIRASLISSLRCRNFTSYLPTYFILAVCLCAFTACSSATTNSKHKTKAPEIQTTQKTAIKTNTIPQPAAAMPGKYLHLLAGKKTGLVVNHTSVVKNTQNTHLVDFLLAKNINIRKIFTPEHGFKGTADAGEKVYNDTYKGIAINSLYGKNKKPGNDQLLDLDLLVFDMQDVGARFYTYISTMHYIMEAAAENNIPVVILDRPNPNGNYVDGPIREKDFESFIAKHPIPVVHGMTVGELAQMINGEGWLNGGLQCQLTVVPCINYNHKTPYPIPIKPSPNLPNQQSIYLYPGLCFFEGTPLSIGRGTQKQFQLIGHTSLKEMPFSFIPVASTGAKYPKMENKVCYGLDLSNLNTDSLFNLQKLDISWLLKMYQSFPDKNAFFLENGFFDKLAGTNKLRTQIEAGLNEQEIRASWAEALNGFKQLRKKYLLYKDFE